jgi:hypothetical protein
MFANNDAATYRVAQDAMKGAFEWLEEGLLTTDWTPPPDGGAKDENTLEGVASAESPEEPALASIREPAGHA